MGAASRCPDPGKEAKRRYFREKSRWMISPISRDVMVFCFLSTFFIPFPFPIECSAPKSCRGERNLSIQQNKHSFSLFYHAFHHPALVLRKPLQRKPSQIGSFLIQKRQGLPLCWPGRTQQHQVQKQSAKAPGPPRPQTIHLPLDHHADQFFPHPAGMMGDGIAPLYRSLFLSPGQRSQSLPSLLGQKGQQLFQRLSPFAFCKKPRQPVFSVILCQLSLCSASGLWR